MNGKSKTHSKELARREPEELSQTVSDIPDYLRQEGPPRGMEEMEQGDRALPRLAIAQSMSPQLKKNDPSFIEDLEEGMWFNTLTKKVYGEECLVVPLLFFKNRIRFRDRKEGGGILCRADNNRFGVGDPGGACSKCPLKDFSDGNKPECTNFFNYASLIVKDGQTRPRMDDLAVVSFKSTALKAAKNWNALITFRGTDMFKGVYRFSTRSEKNSLGEFYVPVIENAGTEDDPRAGWIAKEVMHDFELAFESMAALQNKAGIKFDVEDLAGAGGDRDPGQEG